VTSENVLLSCFRLLLLLLLLLRASGGNAEAVLVTGVWRGTPLPMFTE
jgi:hypothetical protein